MSSFASTFRDAVRGLRRRPGFAAVAIATIALAIGANTAIWSVVSGALLRPLPFRGPERLVSLDVRAYTGHLVSLSVPNYRDWRDRNRGFESFAASAGWTLRLTGRGQAQILNGRTLLGDVFGLLGLTPRGGAAVHPGRAGRPPQRRPAGGAGALIDRLVHHCHIVNIRGNSYRMRQHGELYAVLQHRSDPACHTTSGAEPGRGRPRRPEARPPPTVQFQPVKVCNFNRC